MDKCRPSYYLIEVDETPSCEVSQLKSYYVVHLMQIITDHINDIYNSLVSFKKDARTILKGTIRAASTTREYMEYKRKKLMKEQRKATRYNTNHFPYYLVKYSNDSSSLMYAVLPQRLLSWVINGLVAGPLQLGGKMYQANILYAHNSEEYLLKQLKLLKGCCSEAAYAEYFDYSTQSPKADVWLMLQYSFRPSHFAYKIVNLKETVYQQENPYKDLVAYLPYDDDVIQAIIIRKTHNYSELLQELQTISSFSSSAVFPLQPEMNAERYMENVEPNNLSVLCEIIPTEELTPAELQLPRFPKEFCRR